mgnify:CR=1 FL=1
METDQTKIEAAKEALRAAAVNAGPHVKDSNGESD